MSEEPYVLVINGVNPPEEKDGGHWSATSSAFRGSQLVSATYEWVVHKKRPVRGKCIVARCRLLAIWARTEDGVPEFCGNNHYVKTHSFRRVLQCNRGGCGGYGGQRRVAQWKTPGDPKPSRCTQHKLVDQLQVPKKEYLLWMNK